ncbi:kunitz-type serine protease inhibitor bitisilin-3 [Poecilia formosa]|uniref:Kunitz-type serine protease inhibitor bitisilin-3-like n=1 Tax=Poecilia formosa TaxID=48698 RepID=A0A087XIJ9_POEFO|nr:PREDICTED: kunitz-type serine protease inhibitor bitisilin-3-like [Poecilia formosa]
MKTLLLLGIFLSALHTSNSQRQEFCNLPQDPGQGSTFTFSVYYKPEEDKCLPFFYQGEGGNANRFRSERQCMRNCSFNFEKLYPTDETEACHFKYAPGGCNSKRLRYYYDAIHDKCKTFFWTGCFGNGNRFFDLESCNRTCVGIHDEGDEAEEDEPDTPITIIFAVLLSIVIFAVLLTVILLVVKSKKKHQKKKAKESQADAPLQGSGIEMT